MSKQKTNRLTGKEIRAITKENKKIVKTLEAYKNRRASESEYLTELRIENAKRLLERRGEMGLTITEIALRCGYYDSHYFSKVFKKRVGVSPERFCVKQ